MFETWQQPNEYYQFNQAFPSGYANIDQPHPYRHGGGGVCHHPQMLNSIENPSSFERLVVKLLSNQLVFIIVNYHPLKLNPMFFTEFSEITTTQPPLSGFTLSGQFQHSHGLKTPVIWLMNLLLCSTVLVTTQLI